MESWLQTTIHTLLAAFALPKVGLPAIFVVSLVSATLLPLGSEPAVFAYVNIRPDMFWPAVLVATAGNTIGGAISFLMGAGAESIWHKWRTPKTRPQQPNSQWHQLAQQWFKRIGPPALLLSWLPVIGDPLCAVAGWLKLPFWRSVIYMAIGKFLRYVVLTIILLKAWSFLPFS